MNVESEPIELADEIEIEDRLDEAAEAIPRSILLLRKIAEIRADRSQHAPPIRHSNTSDPSIAGLRKCQGDELCCPSIARREPSSGSPCDTSHRARP